MKKNWFLLGASVLAAVFILSCGGGGGGETTNAVDGGGNVNPPAVHEYVVENLALNLAEANFWSDNGSTWKPENREVSVFQDGKATQAQLEWENFPIKDGDQLDISFDGKVTDGGEISLRVVEKIDGKTTIIYGEVKSLFISGKNIVPSIFIRGSSKSARVIVMLGVHSGKYQFLTNTISVKRTRVKTGVFQMIPIDIGKGKFGSDSGSIWDPKTGTLLSKTGPQRASTKLEWGEISIKANAVSKIILTGHSTPVSDIVIQLRSATGQTLGERIVEFYGQDMTIEIVPTGTDAHGSLRFLFGLSAGTYKLENLRIETE